ncbi:hypothetical protein [Azospirillum thiophilum]|uniref:hypothetical protein n=1 Tax=Azospirillum thiophilum TaxID=528244 RepID=UPI00118748E9|nr:hypothetical protein [Azospirillum thiophilum]
MADNQKEENELAHGAIGWLIILSVAGWYWWCSDGIRSIKSMTIETMFHEKTLIAPRDFGFLKAAGYNTDKLEFIDAINRTNPSKISWSSRDVKIPPTDKTISVVDTIVDYDTPFNGNVRRVVYSSFVMKEHFYHFNPTVMSPMSVSYLYSDGRTVNYNMDHGAEKVVDSFTILFK